MTALCSTPVMPLGTATTMRGLAIRVLRCTFWMKYLSMRSVTSKSAITPSLSGLTATMLPGVRPIIRLASTPTATTCPLLVFSATTLGSLRTMPRPRT